MKSIKDSAARRNGEICRELWTNLLIGYDKKERMQICRILSDMINKFANLLNLSKIVAFSTKKFNTLRPYSKSLLKK